MRKRLLKRTLLLSLVIFLAVCLSSCGLIKNAGGGLKDLLALQRKLAEEFEHNNIKVEIKNRNLGIIFLNSSFNQLDRDTQKEKAQEIALFAKNNYAKTKGVEQISVSFAFSKEYGPVKVKGSPYAFSFKIEELKTPETPPDIKVPWIEMEQSEE